MEDGNTLVKRRKPSRRPTNAVYLLRDALESIDHETLARTIGVSIIFASYGPTIGEVLGRGAAGSA